MCSEPENNVWFEAKIFPKEVISEMCTSLVSNTLSLELVTIGCPSCLQWRRLQVWEKINMRNRRVFHINNSSKYYSAFHERKSKHSNVLAGITQAFVYLLFKILCEKFRSWYLLIIYILNKCFNDLLANTLCL